MRDKSVREESVREESVREESVRGLVIGAGRSGMSRIVKLAKQ